jgi:hypothetical protein
MKSYREEVDKRIYGFKNLEEKFTNEEMRIHIMDIIYRY